MTDAIDERLRADGCVRPLDFACMRWRVFDDCGLKTLRRGVAAGYCFPAWAGCDGIFSPGFKRKLLPQALEINQQVFNGLVSLFTVFAERLADDSLQLRRDFSRERR